MESAELNKMYRDAADIKDILLENNNIGILLYLAKYNPNVTKKDIAEKFGEGALEGLKELEVINLVNEENDCLTLTTEGIFQVDGLLSIMA